MHDEDVEARHMMLLAIPLFLGTSYGYGTLSIQLQLHKSIRE